MKAFFFTILYQPLFNILILLAWLIPGHSIALAIILLTVLIRLALLPSSIKAAHNQAKSLQLQPRVNKIRQEIKDQQEQSKAIMALYKEEEFSPFGSCLPMLIQIPIIWALYSVFRGGLDGNYDALYTFMPRPDVLNIHFLGLDITKPDPLWILPILAGGLQFLLSYLTMPQRYMNVTNSDQASMMLTKQMLYVAPVITIIFGRQLPAALVIYWVTQTLFGVVQQWYVNKQLKSQNLKVKTDEEIVQSPVVSGSKEEPKKEKKNLMLEMMNKRLEKQEKKADVSVTVRTKKK